MNRAPSRVYAVAVNVSPLAADTTRVVKVTVEVTGSKVKSAPVYTTATVVPPWRKVREVTPAMSAPPLSVTTTRGVPSVWVPVVRVPVGMDTVPSVATVPGAMARGPVEAAHNRYSVVESLPRSVARYRAPPTSTTVAVGYCGVVLVVTARETPEVTAPVVSALLVLLVLVLVGVLLVLLVLLLVLVLLVVVLG